MVWFFRVFLREAKKSHANVWAQLKYFSRWKKSQDKNTSSVKEEQPWITFKTIDYLKKNVTEQFRVFEYGGGGSTLFFVKRAKEVITVENNEEWFAILSEMMAKKKYQNWKGNFIKGQSGDYVTAPDISNPDHYSSDDASSKGMNYYNYASAIDAYADNYFDLVLVDGRSRPSCMKHAIPKIKKGGLLILDNSDRDYYHTYFKQIISEQFITIIDEAGPGPYSMDFSKTSIWKKK
jgi:hypothetical protein